MLEEAEKRFELRLTDELGKVRAEMAAMRMQSSQELGKLRSEMAERFGGVDREFGKLRSEIAERFGGVEGRFGGVYAEFGKLRAEMATMKFDILKWSFLFWISQIGVIAGLLSWMLQGVAPH